MTNPEQGDSSCNETILTSHFIAIGKVATAWASFEFMVNMAIWTLVGINQKQGQCLTSQFTTVQTRARALLALFRLLGGNEDVAARVNRFFSKDVSPVALDRNRIVHDPIAVNPAKHVVRVEITADKRHRLKLKDDPLEDALITWNDIKTLVSTFKVLRDEMFSSLPASPKTPPSPPGETPPE